MQTKPVRLLIAQSSDNYRYSASWLVMSPQPLQKQSFLVIRPEVPGWNPTGGTMTVDLVFSPYLTA